MKRTRIIVETREVLVVHGERREGRCPQCGAKVAIVKLKDQADSIEEDLNSSPPGASQPHRAESGDGRRFIRLKSLLKWF